MIQKRNTEQSMLLALKQAKLHQKSEGFFEDAEGKTITLKVKKANEHGICSPYDCF